MTVIRKKKGPRIRFKAKKRMAKIHYKVAYARCDFLLKVNTTVSKNHAIVVILKVRNMKASATGTLEDLERKFSKNRV